MLPFSTKTKGEKIMKNNKKHNLPSIQSSLEKPSTLKDMLDPATLAKLNATGKDLKQQEAKKKEEEQKRREKNKSFAELLDESKLDWKQYK